MDKIKRWNWNKIKSIWDKIKRWIWDKIKRWIWNKIKSIWDKIKQKWIEISKPVGKVGKVGFIGIHVFGFIFLTSYIISMLMSHYKSFAKIIYIIAFIAAILMMLSIIAFMWGLHYDKEGINLIEKLKSASVANIYLLFGSYSLLAILALWSANCKKAIEALYKICFICLFISLVLWIIQVICYNYLLKGQVQKVKINLAKINIVRSILVAISGWVLVMVNVGRISKDIHWTYIYAITTTITTLTYPSLDLFEFIYKLIEKLEKSQNQKGKEEKKTNRRQRKAKEEGRKKKANRKRK